MILKHGQACQGQLALDCAIKAHLSEESLFKLKRPAFVCFEVDSQVTYVSTLQHHLHWLQEVQLVYS